VYNSGEMKRLLTYLFLVLGLGLLFSANSKADNYCIPKKAEKDYFNTIYIWHECYIYHKKVDLNTFVEFALTHALNSVGTQKGSPFIVEENLKWLKKYLRENNVNISKINKSIERFNIAKKEPKKKEKKIVKKETAQTKQADKIKIKINLEDQELINKFATYEKNCVPIEKVGLLETNKKKIEFKKPVKEKICLKVKDILKLGNYKPIKSYPKGMIEAYCNQDNWHCIAKKAGSKVYEIFVKRGETYHARKPGSIIMGMSWYEIMYLNNLRKKERIISRYLNNDPESYFGFRKDVKQINSLLKSYEGLVNMRKALGFSIDDNVEDVIKGQWLLASFLNNNELKVKKVKLHPDIKKRKVLLVKYQSAIKEYKKKLNEKNN